MRTPTLALLTTLTLFLPGCLQDSPALLEEAESPRPPALPLTPSPFTHLLCAGDRLEPLQGRAATDCNHPATLDSGPAAEVHLAANPLDPLHLVGGSKDFSLGEDENCGKYNVWSGVYVSRDGGRTWNHSLLPGYPGDTRKTALSDYACGSDPVLAFGPDGTVYYASIQFTLNPGNGPPLPQLGPIWGYDVKNSAVAVTRSRDGGATWDDPVLLATRENGALLDKEWMAVDPVTGAVYVTYIDTSEGTFYVQRSDDGGQTWTEPLPFITEDPFPGKGPDVAQFGQVAVTADSVVHFIYFAMRENGEATGIFHRASTDRGVTWSAPHTVALWPPLLDLGFTHKYRIVGLPALAADLATGALHVGYPLPARDGTEIRVATSTDSGATWRSTPVNDNLPVSTGEGGPSASAYNERWMPAAAVGPDGTVHVTWLDYRDDPKGQSAFVYYAHSLDGGATWSRNARVSDVPFDGAGGYHQSGSGTIGDYMGLVATEAAVVPFWADTRNGRNDVFSAILLAGASDDI